MKQPSSNFGGEKQQTIKTFLPANAASKEQKDDIRGLSAQTESAQGTTDPSLCDEIGVRLETRAAVRSAKRTEAITCWMKCQN